MNKKFPGTDMDIIPIVTVLPEILPTDDDRTRALKHVSQEIEGLRLHVDNVTKIAYCYLQDLQLDLEKALAVP
jgi:hypothetical protein